MTPDSQRPQVILSANVTHYYYAALALQRAGRLKRYICAIGVNPATRRGRLLLRLLPAGSHAKLATRDISRFDAARVRTIWLPELLQRGGPRLGLISLDRGNWIVSHLFDWEASWSVDDCDIFHFVSSTGLYSARKARQRGCIVVCDERSEHPDYQLPLLRDEYARLNLVYNAPGLLTRKKTLSEYTATDYLIVASSYAKKTYVEAGIDEKRIFVVPYGVDLSQFNLAEQVSPAQTQPKTDDGIFRIMYVGQMVPRKGVQYLIQAFEELALPNSELWLVGGGDGSLDRYIADHAASNPGIKLTGHVVKVDLFRYYNQASVFVLPSLADAYGLVTLEAMACGLPVIVTENTGSKEAVRDGVDGYVIPIRDVGELKDRLRRLYMDPLLRLRMGEAAQLRAQQFTWEAYGERLLAVYDEIMRRGR